MKRRYRRTRFEESGPLYRIEVALLSGIATLTLDTSGPGLHKRGYRLDSGVAPLRETLAAALVALSRWKPGREFADPFCGSGTIAIEAALVGRNVAPGLRRSFVSEEWPHMPKRVWLEARQEARSAIREVPFRILASDGDASVLKIAEQNATRAGLAEYISFQRRTIEEFSSSRKYGCIVCNPPYGERTGRAAEVEKIYRTMGGSSAASMHGLSSPSAPIPPSRSSSGGRRRRRESFTTAPFSAISTSISDPCPRGRGRNLRAW
jgi:putative N6-adenine-specific DNA methylase